MPSARRGVQLGSVVDPEAHYFQTIEEYFVERRGAPLVLSNKDWFLVRRWRRLGVPLRVALRGIDDAMDAHAHSWSRERKIVSLSYCSAEVEVAFERWQRALSVGHEEQSPRARLVDRLAEQLAGAAGLPERVARLRDRIVAGLCEHAGGTASETEPWLQRQEAKLVKALRAVTPETQLAAMAAEVDRELLPYVDKLPADVLSQIRGDASHRRLLETYGLPRLSLFFAE